MSTAWVTPSEARKLWKSAPADDDVLAIHLDAAQAACETYLDSIVVRVPLAPATGWIEEPPGSGAYVWGTPSLDAQSIPTFPTSAAVPGNFKLAAVLQARNAFNAGQAAPSPGGEFDNGGYGISSYPLDWQVKQLLRPIRGLGAIA